MSAPSLGAGSLDARRSSRLGDAAGLVSRCPMDRWAPLGSGCRGDGRGPSMVAADRRAALDHVVVVMFENRSFDNLLGRLYQPGEVEAFEGVARQGAEQPDPWLGRARRGPQGRALWHLAHHEHPLARSG
jgi:phospholipase C